MRKAEKVLDFDFPPITRTVSFRVHSQKRPSIRSVVPAILSLVALLATLALAPAAAASILNSQEQEIATRMTNDAAQGRESLTLDPTLASVARARAVDLAERKYFDHVNPDGVAANYLVREAGYGLPDWWSDDPEANNIESIAAGYPNPASAWSGWMASDSHRTHILGQNSFYAAQTFYGVGYHYEANSPYKHYWVIITAPPPPPPPLIVTAPAANARLTVSEATVTGTAAANSGTATVEARVENAQGIGAYKTANGTTNWSVKVTGLAAGTNTLRVRSRRANGSVLAEVTRTVTYATTVTLTVDVSEGGTVTPGFAGESERIIGRAYTISAKPAAGYLFAGWSGGSTSAAPTLTFTMQNGMRLRAGFIPNPFLAVRGSYAGLITSGQAGEHSGFLRGTLSPTGVLTARLTLDGASYAFTARFGANGAAVVTIPRRGGATPLTLNLQVDLQGGSDQITGSVSGGGWSAGISTDRATFNATTNRAPQAGRYTAVLAARSGEDDRPRGSGFATISISATGVATVAGCLADGTPFSFAGAVSKSGELPLYFQAARGISTVHGRTAFYETNVLDLGGSLVWKKSARSSDAFYPGGFTTVLPVVGSRYAAPPRGARVLDLPNTSPNVTAGIGDGNLDESLTLPATVLPNHTVTSTPGSPKLSLKFEAGSGKFTGSFFHPAAKGTRGISGVVLQKQNAAFGFFRGVSECGWFSLGN